MTTSTWRTYLHWIWRVHLSAQLAFMMYVCMSTAIFSVWVRVRESKSSCLCFWHWWFGVLVTEMKSISMPFDPRCGALEAESWLLHVFWLKFLAVCWLGLFDWCSADSFFFLFRINNKNSLDIYWFNTRVYFVLHASSSAVGNCCVFCCSYSRQWDVKSEIFFADVLLFKRKTVNICWCLVLFFYIGAYLNKSLKWSTLCECVYVCFKLAKLVGLYFVATSTDTRWRCESFFFLCPSQVTSTEQDSLSHIFFSYINVLFLVPSQKGTVLPLADIHVYVFSLNR